MERFILMKDDLLNLDESNLFSIACRNNIYKFSDNMRTIQAYKSKEKKKSSSEFLDYIIEYENFVGDEMYNKIKGVIKFIDDNIIKKYNFKEYSDELKLFYIKLIADYYRKFAEIEHSKKKEFEREAEKYYDEAEKLSKNISISNPIKLGYLLNKTVFLYEIKKNFKKAIELAKSTIKEFDKVKNKLDENADESKDAFSIIDLLRENIEMWEAEK